jgi:hypothetical protein
MRTVNHFSFEAGMDHYAETPHSLMCASTSSSCFTSWVWLSPRFFWLPSSPFVIVTHFFIFSPYLTCFRAQSLWRDPRPDRAALIAQGWLPVFANEAPRRASNTERHDLPELMLVADWHKGSGGEHGNACTEEGGGVFLHLVLEVQRPPACHPHCILFVMVCPLS